MTSFPLRTAIATLCCVGLVGCTSARGIDSAISAQLQEQVLAVANASAAGNVSAAVTRLNELLAAADDALARGEMSRERHAAIVAAARLVSGDLEALATTPAPVQSETSSGTVEGPAPDPAPGAGETSNTPQDSPKKSPPGLRNKPAKPGR